MVIEWYVKMCNEHPLLEYLEDPLIEGDSAGYQKMLKRFKEACPRVKIGVKSWFKSNIDNIKTVIDPLLTTYSIRKLSQRTEMTKKKKRSKRSPRTAPVKKVACRPGLKPHLKRMLHQQPKKSRS